MDRAKVQREFGKAVNMTAGELDRWLETDESRKVGFHRPGATGTNVSDIALALVGGS